MNTSSRAVFLSYASQDAAVAQRIAAAFRAAGLEVWIDHTELRGGDAWDAKIRQQIRTCALFIPLISRNTHQRLEGYFRLEWHLAERRMQQMHTDAAFLLPIVIDGSGEDDEPRVPDKFLDVQWTRLEEGAPPAAFMKRVANLLRSSSVNRTAAASEPGSFPEPFDEPAPSPSAVRMQRGTRTTSPVGRNSRPPSGVGNEKILIIEDDPTMQRVLKDNFEFRGYDVRLAGDGRKGMELVFEFDPDLLVLDIMLPGVNGFDVCRRIRQDGLTTPIIMLTAKSQESDIVLGLNLGADDYVAKPFSVEVLLARVSACLRRHREPSKTSFEFGDCRLDHESHKLFRAGAEVALTPKEFGLLEHFVRHAGRALTREKILDAVWGDDLIVTDRSVDRCINTLRNKVEPDPDHPRFIKTIRDVGYRFEVVG